MMERKKQKKTGGRNRCSVWLSFPSLWQQEDGISEKVIDRNENVLWHILILQQFRARLCPMLCFTDYFKNR